MNIKSCLRSFSVVALAVVVGCAPAKKSTQIGAGAGAVIGGGLGAIVGNQTGSTGGGLTIGLVAGAAAGSLIGNKFDQQEGVAEAQRREIEELKADGENQKAEISLLKSSKESKDQTISSSKMKSAYRNAKPVSAEHGKYAAKAASKTAHTKSDVVSKKATRSNSYAYNKHRYDSSSKAAYGGGTYPASKPKKEVDAKPASVKYSSNEKGEIEITPAVEAKTDVAEKDITTTASTGVVAATGAAAGEVEKTPAAGDPFADFDETTSGANSAVGATTAKPATEPMGSYKWGSTKECAQAGAESAKGNAVTDFSDKLYHYRRAIRLCPGNPTFHKALGETYGSMGRKLDAEFELGEAERLSK